MKKIIIISLMVIIVLLSFAVFGCGKNYSPPVYIPGLLAVSPEAGSAGISPRAHISVTFSQKIKFSTITASTFAVASAEGTVTGTYTYDASTKTLTFIPAEQLAYSTTYEIFISDEVKSLKGIKMASAESWQFTTWNFIEWTTTYNDSANGIDQGLAVAVDDDHIYVAGIQNEGAGNNNDVWLRKYDKEGNTVWTQTYNNDSENLDDIAYCVAVEPSGSVIVAGYSDSAVKGENLLCIRYTSAGVKCAGYPVIGEYSLDDAMRGIVIDSSSNIYGSGYRTISGAPDHSNILAIAADINMTPLGWDKNIDLESMDDSAKGIALDDSGYLYIVGKVTSAANGADVWLAKYDSATGNPAPGWSSPVTYDGNPGRDAVGQGVALDNDGNIYVVGYEDELGSFDNVLLIKYAPDGSLLWKRTYNGPASDFDNGFGIAVDRNNGFVCVVGRDRAVVGDDRIFIRSYNTDGDVLWTQIIDTVGNPDAAFGAAVDEDGYLYVCGGIWVNGQFTDCWLRKYHP